MNCYDMTAAGNFVAVIFNSFVFIFFTNVSFARLCGIMV